MLGFIVFLAPTTVPEAVAAWDWPLRGSLGSVWALKRFAVSFMPSANPFNFRDNPQPSPLISFSHFLI